MPGPGGKLASYQNQRGAIESIHLFPKAPERIVVGDHDKIRAGLLGRGRDFIKTAFRIVRKAGMDMKDARVIVFGKFKRKFPEGNLFRGDIQGLDRRASRSQKDQETEERIFYHLDHYALDDSRQHRGSRRYHIEVLARRRTMVIGAKGRCN